MSRTTNLVLDGTIFTAVLLVASPSLTGMAIHEWLALALLAGVVTHLLFHWQWLVKVTTQFFKKLLHESRLNYVLNLLFLIAMVATMLSGLLISKTVLSTLGIRLNADHSWEQIHKQISDITVVLLALHVAMHLKWIATSLRRLVVRPVSALLGHKPQSAELVAQPVIEK